MFFDERDELCDYMDQGEHEFAYTIFAFESFSDCKRNAQMLNNAPTVIVETFHHGELETHCSKISVSKENIIVTTIKKHTDYDACVLRYYEAENKKTMALFELFGIKFIAEFKPNKIKTFVIDDNKVTETNFFEKL